MNEIRYRVDAERAREAFAAAPEVMTRHLDGAADAGAARVAAYARREAPKFHSHLTNSIRSEQLAPMRWQAVAGVDYARYVEQGVRGPMAHPPGIEHGLLEWVKAKFAPADDKALSRMAFAMAFAMQKRGIRAQPFMAPAAQRSEPTVMAIMRGAVASGIAEVFGHG